MMLRSLKGARQCLSRIGKRTKPKVEAILKPGVPNAIPVAERDIYLRGIARIYQGAVTGPQLRKFMTRYAGRTKDREIIYQIGKLDNVDQQFYDKLVRAFEPGADMETVIPQILAEYVQDPADYARMMKAINPNLQDRITRFRYTEEFVQTRKDIFDPNAPTPRTPGDPELPDGFTLADLGFNDPSSGARAGWTSYGLLGWGDRARPDTRMISVTTDVGGAPRAGRVEGWVHYQKPRGELENQAQRDFITQFRYRYGGNWHASHLGAHRHGFPTGPENLVALDPRLNTSFMARWESYVDFYKRRHGAAYVRAEVQSYSIGPNGEPLADSIRYQLFVPGEDGAPQMVLNSVLDAKWRPGYTRSMEDGYWRDQDLYRSLEDLDAIRTQQLEDASLPDMENSWSPWAE